MKAERLLKLNGRQLSDKLYVLADIDPNAVNKVCLVWHRIYQCPMVCKIFAKASEAQIEYATLKSLNHPNIVRVLELERSRCLLMEYLNGPSLSALLRQSRKKRLSISDALRTCFHLGSAIGYLHHRRLAYLDLKPDNVIVVQGVPKLVDMGTVRPFSPKPIKHIIGSDAYMSPEQCLKLPVGPKADVFSLAVVLFQLICGRLPFPLSRNTELFNQLILKPRALLSERPGVSKKLAAVIESCLCVDPAKRPMLSCFMEQIDNSIISGPRMRP